MAKALHVEDIDSIEFQRREWAVQRGGWVAIGLFVLAALLGVFSVGPLSETVAGNVDDGLEVRYQKFTRHVGTTELQIRLGESAVEKQTASVFVSEEFVNGWRIESITPQPDKVTRTRIGTTFEFSAEAGSPPIVEILYRPDQIGPVDGILRTSNGAEVAIWQLAYP